MTEEYQRIFTEYGDQLETVAYRLAWIKRVVAKHEHSHATVFPAEWHVAQTLVERCCELVSKDVQRVVATLKPHEHHILQAQLQVAISLEELLKTSLHYRSEGLGLVSAFEPVIYLIIAEHDDALSRFINSLEMKRLPTVHVSSEESPGVVYEVWRSALELWERMEQALQDVILVSTGKPLLRLLQVLDDALTDYSQYVMRIEGKRKYRANICICSMNSVSYLFRLRTNLSSFTTNNNANSQVTYGMELALAQSIKQLASQLAQLLVHGEELPKASIVDDHLVQLLSHTGREEVAQAFIRQAVALISKQLHARTWTPEAAAQRRLSLSAYSDQLRDILPFTTRSIWSHAITPMDDLLCILMTALMDNNNQDALVDLYLLKSSSHGFTTQEDFTKRMALRDDWQKQRKLLLASFLKKVPPKPSQLK